MIDFHILIANTWRGGGGEGGGFGLSYIIRNTHVTVSYSQIRYCLTLNFVHGNIQPICGETPVHQEPDVEMK